MNLAEVSIKRPVFAAMMIMALMVFGLISYPKVGVDLYPEVDFPVITATIVYPGADPETMERNVADPVEEAINTLGGIKALRSTNLEGVSIISAEFELEVDGDQALQDVRDRIARLSDVLPSGAEAPVVAKFDIGAFPIITVGLAADMGIGELTQVADKTVKARLQTISGVGNVDIVGGRERQIQVFVDPVKLSGLGLSVDDVANGVRSQNVELPAGSLERGGADLSAKLKGELANAQEVGDILLSGPGGPVRLKEVAQVVDGVEPAKSASFLDGKPAVTLVVSKQSGSNTVEVAHEIKKALEGLKEELNGRGVTLTVPTDNSTYIEHSINDVKLDLGIGAGLAVFVIMLFLLDLRATAISAVAIPTSVVATFAFIGVMNFTFNNMTMLALSLAIGILVDDAIVVIENIHRHLQMGKSAMQASADGTGEIFLAVLAMTSTIIAVFLPVAVMKGIVGRFFLQFGLTVSFAVAVSMLVSFTLTPMLSSRLLRPHASPGRIASAIGRTLDKLDRAYGRVISWSLSHRAATLGLTFLALVFSGIMVSRVPSEFVPEEDRAMYTIRLETPAGTPLEAAAAATESVAKDLRENAPGVVSTLSTIGGGTEGEANVGEILVNLTGSKTRSVHQKDLMAWVRERYSKLGDGSTLTVSAQSGGGGGAPIQYSFRGQNLDDLVKAGQQLKAELEQTPGFVDVGISYKAAKPELNLIVDRERASALGVPVSSVATTIRSLLAGDKVSELKQGGEAYDIVVKLPEAEESRIETLSALKVRSMSGALIDLSNVVRSERGVGPTRIEREARQRQVTVTAALEGLVQGDATKIVLDKVPTITPKGVTGQFAGDSQMMTESMGYMGEALMIAVLLVYMILAAQFNSFIHPITIMVSMPLSVIGAFGALYIAGMSLSIFAMIGVIMLMGLVTKNAILLVDFTEQLRAEGMEMRAALIKAGILRLRPILMTAFSMVFGMLPVALAISEGGESRAPMAVCVIGGLITSTVLTLVVVPVIYTLMDALTNNRLTRYLSSKIFSAGAAHPEGTTV